MPIKIKLLMIFSSILFSTIAAETCNNDTTTDANNINWWCSKTPHAGLCRYFLSHNHKHKTKHTSEFRDLTIQVALERALNSRSQVLNLGSRCQNQHEKRVWSDCLKLHANTIDQLNNTLIGLKSKNKKSCTNLDAQTWLSTALTNLQTCQSGSLDLNVTDFITPSFSKNLSDLISNSLAVNGLFLNSSQNYTTPRGFPTWFTRNERLLLQTASLKSKASVVVTKDGTGHYTTVQAAINLAAKRKDTNTRFVIYVKSGVYKENVQVGYNNNNIWLVGDGLKATTIVSGRSVAGGYTTYSSATFGIEGLRFVARGITFENTAGPRKAQAVAFRSASDLSVYYRCSFKGYQDTLFVHSQRQFYRECYIYGTIDFIFGNAAVVFQNCMIYVRNPLHGQANVITAQGRNDPFQNTAISIHNSRILPAPDLKPLVRSVQTYLGRPWMQYSRTVILKTYIEGFIAPMGWSRWQNSNFALDTLYYGEYKNLGPGASTSKRVNWRGFHVISKASEASRFTVNSLLAGQSWLPSTSVPFTPGL